VLRGLSVIPKKLGLLILASKKKLGTNEPPKKISKNAKWRQYINLFLIIRNDLILEMKCFNHLRHFFSLDGDALKSLAIYFNQEDIVFTSCSPKCEDAQTITKNHTLSKASVCVLMQRCRWLMQRDRSGSGSRNDCTLRKMYCCIKN
jgi:hypothetical protein